MTCTQLQQRLSALSAPSELAAIVGIQRGIEREALRTNKQGGLSTRPHPIAIGCALTNSMITTDFSEALLEFITPVSDDPEETLAQLRDLQKFTLEQLDGELLWPVSMPCYIQDQDEIPLAQFGSSNIGRMKTLYREGLKNRYGSMMQAIAGVHFNISFPQSLWRSLQKQSGDTGDLQSFISDGYLGLIRNFKRELWLISYLFGASPALCSSFLEGRKTDLPFKSLGKGSLYLEHGTALRLGDLGYTNSAQSSLRVMYNSLEEYVDGLKKAISLPSDLYQDLNDYHAAQPQQLNKNILQIENEFYSPIRPKRNARSGEKPTQALLRGGIEYIEIRALDVNPFADTGIDLQQIHFLDVFLTYCLLKASPQMSWDEQTRTQENLDLVVNQGRDPELVLKRGDQEVLLTHWAADIFAELAQVADYMDKAYGVNYYRETVNELASWVEAPEKTTSGRYMSQLLANNEDNGVYALTLAKDYLEQHQQWQYHSFDKAYLQQQAEQSVQAQKDIEAADSLSFEAFLDDYFQEEFQG
ncbi:glutamate--cysteine ligase [Pseudoalteromonas sp. BDTF-M6]|uniref:glutamate--cysteine ligase n=1 Tax=Pseudoalteromonas sp. BDTF-M6 TaxID=2796132 RepID=UPI001BAF71B0|nr:glutamate--cysteine ligase [Pseudoalteromonas sp. BDTF-M6]MBS3796242.1 glutamate--cysteine ligase [Pseudoalteromonas sp. BDTF-M6]